MNNRDLDEQNEPLGDHLSAPEKSGLNLYLVYGLMLLALLVAIGLATMVVWPFYTHRH